MKKRICERNGMRQAHMLEYNSWRHIKSRCLNQNDNRYKCYGGRGIKVCEKWKNSFTAFYIDMGAKPFSKAQIDRINNDGNYEPNNCRWVSITENNRNRSITKLNPKKVLEIKKLRAEGFTRKDVGIKYNCDHTTIRDIELHKTWKDVV